MTATRQSRPVVLLRPVPGTSLIHELWAGTKVVVFLIRCCWRSIRAGADRLVAALVAVAVWMARIPRGAVPSMPRWLWLLMLFGGVTAALAEGSPVLACRSVEVGLGGLLNFLRITALSIVLLALGAMVSWTTNVADIAPAVSTLGRPLRCLRIPVDDWAVGACPGAAASRC